MTIVLADPDFILHQGEALAVLRTLADESVDCVVTSPPYWGLRDYGTGSWVGGDPECQHVKGELRRGINLAASAHSTRGEAKKVADVGTVQFGDTCATCGATRVDDQIGLERTPDAYVASMVAVFAEIRRALTKTGTCWVNLGDSYASATKGSGGLNSTTIGSGRGQSSSVGSLYETRKLEHGLKEKDLVGIPWRVAFALQADGWYLRSDVIWAKANPMPESIADRPSKSHEYVFLLTKSARYYFDQEAVREPHAPGSFERVKARSQYEPDNPSRPDVPYAMQSPPALHPSGRNLRSVWTISTQAYAEAHFATFPEELPRRCIVAGCPEWVCTTCGKPRERIIETTYEPHGASAKSGGDFAGERTGGDLAHGSLRPQEMKHGRATRIDSTLGWSDCGHASYRAGIVLDPFMGSGTTAKVARDNARHAIGIELNPDYCDLIARRNQQLSLFTYGKGSP